MHARDTRYSRGFYSLVGFSNKGCVRGGGGRGGIFFLFVFFFSLFSPSGGGWKQVTRLGIGSKKIIVERIVGIDLSDEGGIKKKERVFKRAHLELELDL